MHGRPRQKAKALLLEDLELIGAFRRSDRGSQGEFNRSSQHWIVG
nr:C866 [uncultured bacterium]